MNRLWDAVALPGKSFVGRLHARDGSVALADLTERSVFDVPPEDFRGHSVLLATGDQRRTALALLELDGVARRLVLCTPDLGVQQLERIAAMASADIMITSDEGQDDDADGGTRAALPRRVRMAAQPSIARPFPPATIATEWILLTSGTTGIPKLVVHTLDSLAGGLPRQEPGEPRPSGGSAAVWSTFYDIRRYGGLQILLRAVLGGASLVLSAAGEPIDEFIARAGAAGVTHVSGTPSHWRRALMSGAAGRMQPNYVRLSGEVADQAVLDALRTQYPGARIGHAFASTEAGVAFDVNDGLEGFPASLVDHPHNGVDMRVRDGTLRIRSTRNAARYLGDAVGTLSIEDGYVDTGDMVELVDGRYHFRGRRGGVINVGGLKVFPEEVEAVLNADPRVRMSLVRARRNPVTGAVVMADVVLDGAASPDAEAAQLIKTELLEACRRALPPYKVPATLRFVPSLELSAAGKLVRAGA